MTACARRQRGMALLTVLLLVAVMAALAIAMLDDIRFGLRRSQNAQAIARAQWSALSAESLAQAQIERLLRRDPGRTTLEGGWNGRPFVFPLEGGSIRAVLRDGGNCFNLNSVVQGAPEQWWRRETGVAQYLALLDALDIRGAAARSLADALVDWIDSDGERSPYGAEDAAYAQRRPAYRTGGALLAEPSELRAIAGYDAGTYRRLRPHVCALPDAALSPINLNTLEQRDAPLLRMLAGAALDDAGAKRVIAARPAGGWTQTAAFWSQPALRDLPLPGEVLGQVRLRTRYFGLRTQVASGDAELETTTLFDADPGGRVRLLERRWSEEE